MARFLNRTAITTLLILSAATATHAGQGGQGGQAPAGKPTPAEAFNTTLRQAGGPAKARAMYDALKKKTPTISLFEEQGMNLYGYELLNGGNAKDAVIVFQMNADEHPKSANVYDSLADGQLAAGDKVGALKNSEKALALLAGDTNISDQTRAAIKDSAEKKISELKPKKP